jgi:hypothetical protein
MRGLWSRFLGGRQTQDPASERWRATLRAASQAPFYAGWRRELNRALQATNLSERYEALAKLPEVELDYFFAHFRQFRRDEPSVRPRDARTIWPTESRLAVVAPWFHVGGGVKLFLRAEREEIRKHAPEVMAAPVDTLEALAAMEEEAQDESLFALVALTGVGTPLLSGASRLKLWRRFGVPVYAQLRGFQGELLARECEAHDGLHFDAAGAIFERRPSGELLLTSLDNQRHTVLRLATRLEAAIETRPCECGLASPRLMELQEAKGRGPAHPQPSPPSLTALAAAVRAPEEEATETARLR